MSLDKDMDVCWRDALHHYLITTDKAPTVPPLHFDAVKFTSPQNTRQVQADTPVCTQQKGHFTQLKPIKCSVVCFVVLKPKKTYFPTQ